jgi:hypothetical protein
VDTGTPPFAHVVASGPITITEDPDDLIEYATRIGGRYMGEGRADEFGARNGVPGEYLVRLHCERISGASNVSD